MRWAYMYCIWTWFLKDPLQRAARTGREKSLIPPREIFWAQINSSYRIFIKMELRTVRSYSNPPRKYFWHRRCLWPSQEQFLSVGGQNRAKNVSKKGDFFVKSRTAIAKNRNFDMIIIYITYQMPWYSWVDNSLPLQIMILFPISMHMRWSSSAYAVHMRWGYCICSRPSAYAIALAHMHCICAAAPAHMR